MSLPVIWSPASKQEYADLLEYLEQEFGIETTLKFLDKTESVLAQISNFPESGTLSPKLNIRRGIISKQTSVLYQIQNDSIEILHFWDNRQNPDTLENEFNPSI